MNPLKPFLLDPEQLAGLGPKALRKLALELFCQHLVVNPPATDVREAALAMLANDDARLEWNRCIAAELLLARAIPNTEVRSYPDEFAEVRPFGEEGPTLAELWDRSVAACLIPIKAERGPALAQLWLVADPDGKMGDDHRHRWKTASEWLTKHAPGCKLFAVGTQEFDLSIEGPSWQLGAALACRGLEERRPKMIVELAAEWIVTGRVQARSVEEVAIGNKTDLRLNRRWMLPEGNWPHLTPEFRATHERRIALVPNLDSAWNHVTGAGTLEETARTDWPLGERVEAFHCLVSQAIRPMIASILCTQPRLVYLWVSKQFAGNGTIVKEVLEKLSKKGRLPEALKVFPEPISSASMPDAEQALKNQGRLHLPTAKTVVFNITGGNMLMKWAVINLAALNPQLWLIYRDVDAGASHHFTRLRSKGSQFATANIQPDESKINLMNWDFLLVKRPDPSKPDTIDSLLAGILDPDESPRAERDSPEK